LLRAVLGRVSHLWDWGVSLPSAAVVAAIEPFAALALVHAPAEETEVQAMGHIMRASVAAACLACIAKAWSVDNGPCQSYPDGCVSSWNYPGEYGDYELCTMSGSVGCTIRVVDFGTETGYDVLTVNGNAYSGTDGPEGVIPDGMILWRTDDSDVSVGWKICPDCFQPIQQAVDSARSVLHRQSNDQTQFFNQKVDNAQGRLSGQIDAVAQSVHQEVDSVKNDLSGYITHAAQDVQSRLAATEERLRDQLDGAEQHLQEQIFRQGTASLARLVAATEENLTDRINGSEHSLQEQISNLGDLNLSFARLSNVVDSGNAVARNTARETARLSRVVNRSVETLEQKQAMQVHEAQRNITHQVHALAYEQAALASQFGANAFNRQHDFQDAISNLTHQSLANSMEVRRNVTETLLALEQKQLQNRAAAAAGMQELTARLKSTERAMTARMRDEVGTLAYQYSKDEALLQHDVEALAPQGQAAATVQLGWFQGLVLCTCAAALSLTLSTCLRVASVSPTSIQMPLLSQGSPAPVSVLQAAAVNDNAVRVEEGAVLYNQGQQQQQEQQQLFHASAQVPFEARRARMEHEVSRLTTFTTSQAIVTSSQGASSSVEAAPGLPMEFSLADSSAVSVASADDAASSHGSSPSRGWLVSG